MLVLHGHSRESGRSPEYAAWDNMIQRCTNPKKANFKWYGGRGIGVCERWRTSFSSFLADIGPRPSLAHSLDRFPDNNGDYAPGNVRWATRAEQHQNTRANVQLTYGGETLYLTEWARRFGLPSGTLSSRVSRGWSTVRALTASRRAHTTLGPRACA